MAAPAVAPILPGSTLGILGGGQLGAMFAMAARRMGYRVEAISDVADCPAAIHCDRLHVGAYTDTALLARVAADCDVVTFEFENIPAEAGRSLAAAVPVRPSPDVLFTTQDRAREKTFLARHNFACAPHRIVNSAGELRQAAADLGLPAVLKTAAFGYDGKGQMKLVAPADIEPAWTALGAGPDGPRQLVLEGFIDFDCEISVVAARGTDGSVAVFPPSRNAHANHILDVSSVPAGLATTVIDEAVATTGRILEALGVVGVACVEFFVTKDGRVLVNEIAPRTHNSGHLTIEACETQPPDLETRLAILRNKAEREGTVVPGDVLEYIASRVTSNIRELEGALIRVSAYSSLNRVDMTVPQAERLLEDLLPSTAPKHRTDQELLTEIAGMLGFGVDALRGKSRQRPLVMARQEAMYVFRELTDLSYPAIARLFGGRDHTTVIHAVDKITRLMAERSETYDRVTMLVKNLKLS